MSRRNITAGAVVLCLFYWTLCAHAEEGTPLKAPARPDTQSPGDVQRPRDAPSANEIFMSSDPINAVVYLKNDMIGKTPFRLTGVEQGKFRLRIEKQGYEPLKEEITIRSTERQQFFFNLTPFNVQIVLTQKNQDVFINEKRVGGTPLEINKLPEGTYDISRQEGGISVSYRGFSEIRRMVRYETYFSAAFLVASLAGRMYFDKRGDEKIADSLDFSSLIFMGLLGYNLLKSAKLSSAARTQLEQMTAIEVETYRADSERNNFSNGMELVGREQWNDALLKFNFVYNMFPDSEYSPLCVYEIGYCHYMMEDYEKAAQYFRLSVFEYPIFELFPYAVYYFLDSLLKRAKGPQVGQDQKTETASLALSEYEALRPVHVEDSSGELQKDYYDVLTGLYEQSGKEGRILLTDLEYILNEFIEKNSDASAFPDIYLLKGKLLYTYLDRGEGIRVLNEVKTRYNYDKNIMKEIESIMRDGR